MKIINGEEIKISQVMQALDLDYRVYPNSYHISKEQCLAYFNKNRQIYFCAIENNKVVGYLNFSPISKEIYEKIISGNYTDTIIQGTDIMQYKNGENSAYLSSIVVDPTYRHLGIATKLISELINLIINLSKEGIFIDKIVSDVISNGGEVLATKLGLKLIKHSNNNSKIFEAKLIPLDIEITEINKNLIDVYQKVNNAKI